MPGSGTTRLTASPMRPMISRLRGLWLARTRSHLDIKSPWARSVDPVSDAVPEPLTIFDKRAYPLLGAVELVTSMICVNEHQIALILFVLESVVPHCPFQGKMCTVFSLLS